MMCRCCPSASHSANEQDSKAQSCNCFLSHTSDIHMFSVSLSQYTHTHTHTNTHTHTVHTQLLLHSLFVCVGIFPLQCVCLLLLEDLCQRQFNTLALCLFFTFFLVNCSSRCCYVPPLQQLPTSLTLHRVRHARLLLHITHTLHSPTACTAAKMRTHTLNHTFLRYLHHTSMTFINPTELHIHYFLTSAQTSPGEIFENRKNVI